jgi:hypothetical protein
MVSTLSGKTAVAQVEAIDVGTPLDPNLCQGVSSPHDTFENLSNGADNGSDRSQMITINTTDFVGYRAEACYASTAQFMQKVINPKTGAVSLAPANPTTLPDGTTPGFQGLLPDCGNNPNTEVNCSKLPGVSLRQTSPDGTVHTLVVTVAPGFDSYIGN